MVYTYIYTIQYIGYSACLFKKLILFTLSFPRRWECVLLAISVTHAICICVSICTASDVFAVLVVVVDDAVSTAVAVSIPTAA